MVVMRRDEPVERGDSLELTVPTDGRRLPDVDGETAVVPEAAGRLVRSS